MAWLRVTAAMARRPDLWGIAVRQLRRSATPGWWRRVPFLPVPSGDYMRFRAVTNYGDDSRRPAPIDVVHYLEWCKQWERTTR